MISRVYKKIYIHTYMHTLEGKCLQSNVIYQATVTTATTTETYVGLATNFKEEMKRNSQNIFGLYKTLRNLSR